LSGAAPRDGRFVLRDFRMVPNAFAHIRAA